MSIGISLKGVDRMRRATDGNTSRPPPVRHPDWSLAAAIAAATGLERKAACRAVTATMAALGDRLPRSTSQRLADLLPHDLVRSVLAGEPTGTRFGGFEIFVREVASRSRLDDATARVGVLAVGRELQRRLSPPILQEVCVEVPRAARLLAAGCLARRVVRRAEHPAPRTGGASLHRTAGVVAGPPDQLPARAYRLRLEGAC